LNGRAEPTSRRIGMPCRMRSAVAAERAIKLKHESRSVDRTMQRATSSVHATPSDAAVAAVITMLS
jgi:hypothetical protein